jgi:hypothetical protein
MKPADISGIKRDYLKDKINSKNKNIRDLYRIINKFKRATNLEVLTKALKMLSA